VARAYNLIFLKKIKSSKLLFCLTRREGKRQLNLNFLGDAVSHPYFLNPFATWFVFNLLESGGTLIQFDKSTKSPKLNFAKITMLIFFPVTRPPFTSSCRHSDPLIIEKLGELSDH